jgi:hypothetical protein
MDCQFFPLAHLVVEHLEVVASLAFLEVVAFRRPEEGQLLAFLVVAFPVAYLAALEPLALEVVVTEPVDKFFVFSR